jgi:GNAT superfamily N-acetyltransferase
MPKRLQARDALEILDFDPRYRDHFRRLNTEWLEKYFYVEARDHQVLSNPEAEILAPGGFVFLARYQGEIVGTCALIKAGRGTFELSKMAVTERYQGLGIGQRLLTAAVAQFRKTGARRLFLESSSKLTRALTLYEANGFRFAPLPQGSAHYQRADVYMEYTGPPGTTAKKKGRAGRRTSR